MAGQATGGNTGPAQPHPRGLIDYEIATIQVARQSSVDDMAVHAAAQRHWEDIYTTGTKQDRGGEEERGAQEEVLHSLPSEWLDPNETLPADVEPETPPTRLHATGTTPGFRPFGALDRVLDEYYKEDLTLSESACDRVK